MRFVLLSLALASLGAYAQSNVVSPEVTDQSNGTSGPSASQMLEATLPDTSAMSAEELDQQVRRLEEHSQQLNAYTQILRQRAEAARRAAQNNPRRDQQRREDQKRANPVGGIAGGQFGGGYYTQGGFMLPGGGVYPGGGIGFGYPYGNWGMSPYGYGYGMGIGVGMYPAYPYPSLAGCEMSNDSNTISCPQGEYVRSRAVAEGERDRDGDRPATGGGVGPSLNPGGSFGGTSF